MPERATSAPLGMGDLVNQLTQQLAESQRVLAASQQKLAAATRSLEARTQELTEARAALSLLLATLDTATEGILAMGHFGRAMHYNARFIALWRIPQDKLASLNEPALLALQMAQVRDPARLLAHHASCKAHPEQEHFSMLELTDGRILECRVVPQKVRGKRIGTVTSWRDVTEHERRARLVCALETQAPQQLAEARATVW